MGTDHRLFDICDGTGKFLCPSCGLPGYFEGCSYNEDGPIIGSGICPCCMFEPGFDDDPAASGNAEPTVLATIFKYRANWIKDGRHWLAYDDYWFKRPPGWDPQKQLEALIERFPWLQP